MRQSPNAALLLDQAREKIIVLSREGVIEYANRAAERILGYEPEGLVGTNAFEYVHEDDRESVRTQFEEVIASDETYYAESATYRFRASDGAWVWLESRLSNVTDAALDGYVVSSRDVTDRVEAERERREVQSRLRELTTTTSDVLWMVDGEWSEVLFCNPAFEEVYGMSVERLEGEPRSFLDAIHPEDVPAVEEALERLTGGERVDMEYRTNPPGEDDRWVWVQGEPITEDGEVVRIAGFARDVTERRRRERQLAVMDNLLRHNIRNQMNAILGFTDIIEEKTLAETAGEVAVIRRAGERLLETAEKQRDIISALQSPIRREPIDLVAAVEAAVGAVREDHPRTEVEVSLPDRLVVRAVDELRCAIAELLANAIHHNDGPEPGLTVAGRTADGEATLVVGDDCEPLAEFDRNVLIGDHDMDTVYHSSGCGLWLVYWTVDLSGGHVDYRYDDGNVISLRLPLAE